MEANVPETQVFKTALKKEVPQGLGLGGFLFFCYTNSANSHFSLVHSYLT